MKPLPWSFTALEKFKNCPHAYHEIRILKSFTEEQGEAAKWGNYVHEQIENYINHGTPMAGNTEIFSGRVQETVDWMGGREGMIAEIESSLSTTMTPCGWTDPDVWVRGILDLLRVEGPVAWVADWKTGKVKPNSKQMKLFALLVFYKYPEVQICHTRFVWLANGKAENTETYFRVQVQEMWKDFIPDLTEYTKAFKQDVWQKRQSGLCGKWCAVLSCFNNGKNK